MGAILCANCSTLITANGRRPTSCPFCGYTLDNAPDATNTLDRATVFAETVLEDLAAKLENLGRYEIESKLGGGGFGIVYLARDPKLGRHVALKVPTASRRESSEAIERFSREARYAARLRHPGIVSVYNVEEDRGLTFIISEYVEGEALSNKLRTERFSNRAAASLVAAVAAAVDYAHSQGIIHRDIKPGNIMIDPAGNPRLMDFGLAKHETSDPTVTRESQVMGTPAYMSPEQARGSRQIDRRADVYSLGAVLYHLLTNQLPFQGDSRSVIERVRSDVPDRPRTINKHIPSDLETICLKAMEKEPARRYQTARDLADDLERWLRGEPIVARHIGKAERAVRWCRRNPAPAGLIAAVVLLLLVSTGGFGAVAAVQTSARRRVEDALEKNKELLSRAYVERGTRHVRGPASSEDYSPLRALPWINEASTLDTENANRFAADRIRLQTQLELAPALRQMWVVKDPVRWIFQARLISPKRTLLLNAGMDGTVHLWPLSEGRAPLSLPHPAAVRAAAFSPDEKLLATAAEDGVRIWDPASGHLLKGPLTIFDAKQPNVSASSVAFSKSGQLVAAGSFQGGVQLWNVSRGEQVAAAFSSRRDVVADWIEFADSDRVVVLLHRNSTITVDDAATGKEKYKLRAKQGIALAARVGPDGTTIAGLTNLGAVILWNAHTGEQIGLLETADSRVSVMDAAFSSDGKLLAAGSADGTVRLWKTHESQLVWRQQISAHSVNRLEFSPDDSALLFADARKKAGTLTASTGEPISESIGSFSQLVAAHWVDSAGRIATIDHEGVARLWETQARVDVLKIPLPNGVSRASLSADRGSLAMTDGSLVCLLRLPLSHREPAFDTFPVEDSHLGPLFLSEDGSRLAVIFGNQHQVAVWDTAAHRRIAGPLAHSDRVTLMRFSPDASLLVCISWDGKATVWNIATGQRLYQPVDVGKDFSDIDIDPQGKQCAVAAMMGVAVWDLASGKRLRPGYLADPFPTFARFVNEPGHLLVAGHGQPVQIWDLATGQSVRAVRKRGECRSLALSDDMTRFLAGYADSTARLWRVDNAAPVSPSLEHPAAVQAVALDPTSRWAATVAEDNQLSVWDAQSAELIWTCPLNFLQSRVPVSRSEKGSVPAVLLTFFSPNSQSIHVLTRRGLLFNFPLAANKASSKEMGDDLALRSGAEFDGQGDLRALEPDELAALANEQTERQNRTIGGNAVTPKRLPAGRSD